MCGIAGYMSRTGTEEPIGRVLLDMLTGLARRGPDSAGMACFRPNTDGSNVAWIRLPSHADAASAEATVRGRLAGLAEIRNVQRRGDLLRLQLWLDAPAAAISRALERPGEDFEVVSIGEHLELVKQVGAPGGLESTFGVAAMRGSHGIGHTRLSTESRVDLSHSQPFWAHGVADLATVHNGHITNYDRLRRIYEQ
jgi:glutamate synthase domain-containing protein 1